MTVVDDCASRHRRRLQKNPENIKNLITETPQKEIQNGLDPHFFITNFHAVQYERSKRSYRMTVKSDVFLFYTKHNTLTDNGLRNSQNFSVFAYKISRSRKYSILRAPCTNEFNISAPLKSKNKLKNLQGLKARILGQH